MLQLAGAAGQLALPGYGSGTLAGAVGQLALPGFESGTLARAAGQLALPGYGNGALVKAGTTWLWEWRTGKSWYYLAMGVAHW